MIHFRHQKNKGFTLIETMLVIAILIILAFVLTPIIKQGIDAWVFSISTSDLLAEGRLAMLRMTKELRTAGSISAMSSTSLSFIKPGFDDVFQYTWLANVLHRIVPARSQDNILARDISAFSFTYLKRDSTTVATTTAEVWEIRIDFTVTKEGRSLRFGSTVSPRNIAHP